MCTVRTIRTCVMIMATLHIQGVSHYVEIMLSYKFAPSDANYYVILSSKGFGSTVRVAQLVLHGISANISRVGSIISFQGYCHNSQYLKGPLSNS